MESRKERDVYGEMTRIASRAYMEGAVNISLVNRLVYIVNPKVANSTIKKTLQTVELSRSPIRDNKIKDVHDRRSSPLLWPAQLPRAMFNEIMTSDDYFVFTFVRNPYSRLLSAYLDKFCGDNPKNIHRTAFLKQMGRPLTDEPTFEEFVDGLMTLEPRAMNHHWRPQSVCLFHGAIDYDFIGRFEDFEYQFGIVKERLFAGRSGRLSTLTERPHQTDAGSRLARYYTPSVRQKVRDLYRDDFLNFGYSADVLEGSPPSRGKEGVCSCRDGRTALLFGQCSMSAERTDEAVGWFEQAAALGTKEGHYWLGRIREDRGEYELSAACYRSGAEAGQPTCMRGLARAHHLGRGVPLDAVQERAWLERAASLGDGKSALRLAELVSDASGDETAVEWFEKAAALGVPRAYYHLGRHHETHDGRDSSFTYFREGADRGDVPCMRGVSRAYELGRGVEKDEEHAYYWRERAESEAATVGAPVAAHGHFFVKLPRRVGMNPGDPTRARYLDILDGFATIGQRVLRRSGYGGYEIDTAATLCTLFGLSSAGALRGPSHHRPFTFFDVGSNVGHYSLLAKALWRDARVVAFEPTPDTHGWLRRVAAANGLDVRAENVAVGSEAGEATLYLSTVSDASNSLNPSFRTHKGELVVRCVTLDGYCNDTDLRPDVVKIDVETHEQAVLEGAESLLRAHRPFLVAEVRYKPGIDHGGRGTAGLDAVGGYHYYRIDGSPRLDRCGAVRAQTAPGFRDWLVSPVELGEEFFAALVAWRRTLSVCTRIHNVPPPATDGAQAAMRQRG